MQTTYVAYYRVSTRKQDYGIDAQKTDVARYLKSVNGVLLASYEEKESGRNCKREALAQAIALCKSSKARLIIAKLDRLSRNAHFIMSLQESNLDFVCCDMPNVDRFTIGILALVAQREAETISARTKAGLAVARERGVKLGCPTIHQVRLEGQRVIKEQAQAAIELYIKPINEIRKTGCQSYGRIAEYMNLRGIRTQRGKEWTGCGVRRVILAAESKDAALICS